MDKREEKFGEKEAEIRRISVEKGRKSAEKACNNLICPGLKALKLDPFDIKPILSPVDFVAFRGMYKEESIREILFLTRERKAECCKELDMIRQQVIDNCIVYGSLVLQFSICLTAAERAISHAVIHKKAILENKYDWQVARIDDTGKIEME